MAAGSGHKKYRNSSITNKGGSIIMTINENIISTKKTARTAGLLFITATVASVIGYLIILSPFLDSPDFLTRIAENRIKVILGVIIDAINCVAVVAIPVILFPIFKKHNETLAVGYVGSRIIESVILIIGHISHLLLVSLSGQYVRSEAANTAIIQNLGAFVLSIGEWTHLLGPMIAFSLTALILNFLFYRSKLVPSFISVWGLIGAVMLLATGLAGMFGFNPFSTVGVVLTLPIALNEMVLAVWLIIKGFNSTSD
jgi:hypothetical protein